MAGARARGASARTLTRHDALSPATRPPTSPCPPTTARTVSLADLRGRKVIVYFYPAAMTPGCTKQACDFTDSLDSLQAPGYDVLGISPDTPAKLAKFRERDDLDDHPASDADRTVMHGLRRLRREEALRQDGRRASSARRSSSTRTVRSTLAQYNVKATGHVAKLRRDLGLA